MFHKTQRKYVLTVLSDKIKGFEKPTIWAKTNKLALDLKCVNMGQGFPDWQPPEFFLTSFEKNLKEGSHQYTRSLGDPKLVGAVARAYSKVYNRNIDPLTEVCISNGAVQLLYNSITSLVNPGDEVILFEPFYDCYYPQSMFNHAKVISIPMIPSKLRELSEYSNLGKPGLKLDDSWKLDFDKLKKSVSNKTKLIIINSPHNPSGKVFTQEELEQIADIISPYPNLFLLSDEVYEHMIYDDIKKLPRFANVKGMWDRTISIMSAGKIFSATGTRIGWGIGPQKLIHAVFACNQYNSFCLYGPLQQTIADCLDQAMSPYNGEENYYVWLRKHYENNRNYFLKKLAECGKGLKFWLPQGGYVVVCDISNQKINKQYSFEGENCEYTKDFQYLLQLAHENRVIGIPVSPFFIPEHAKNGENMIRFAFCKKKETIDRFFEHLK